MWWLPRGWWSSSWSNSVARPSCQAASKKVQKNPFLDEKFGEKSYFRHENFLKTIFGCFCAGSLPTRLDSMKSSTTPWEPFTRFLGFRLMLPKNPFNIIRKHINAPSVPILVKIEQKLWPGSPKWFQSCVVERPLLKILKIWKDLTTLLQDWSQTSSVCVFRASWWKLGM